LQQLLYVDPGKPPKIVNLGTAPAGMSLRVFVDGVMRKSVKGDARTPTGPANPGLLKRSRAKRATMDKTALMRGKLY
jgi:hypothetical protein